MSPTELNLELTPSASQLLYPLRGDSEALVYQQQQVRWLSFGGAVVQSAMDVGAPQRLMLPYLKAMAAMLCLTGAGGRILNLGFGGGALVRFIQHYLPDLEVVSVERQGTVVELSRQYFHIADDYPVYIDSADNFLQHHADRYPLMLIDLPLDVVMKQGFLKRCQERLDKNGVVVINLFYRHPDQLPAVLSMLREPFATVHLLDITDSPNLVVVAGNKVNLQADAVAQRAAYLANASGLPVTEYLQAHVLLEPVDVSAPGTKTGDGI